MNVNLAIPNSLKALIDTQSIRNRLNCACNAIDASLNPTFVIANVALCPWKKLYIPSNADKKCKLLVNNILRHFILFLVLYFELLKKTDYWHKN